jgi:hypothetical protein
MVDDLPDSACSQINPVGAEFIAGLVMAKHESLGATEVHIYGVNLATFLAAVCSSFALLLLALSRT